MKVKYDKNNLWKRVKIPTSKKYLAHLNKFNQYTDSPGWNEWYSKIAPLKGVRVAKTLLQFKGSGARVLDLGCGIGLTLGILVQVFPKTIGCEVEEGITKAAKEFSKNNFNKKVRVVTYNGVKIPFPDNSFDIVTSIEVIEHTDKPEVMLKEIRRVLKPDGILHITTANKWWPIEPHFKLPFLSYLPPKLSDFYVKIAGKGQTYQNIHLPSYGEFYKLVSKHFLVEDLTLDVIRNYKLYGLAAERGERIKYLAFLLNAIQNLRKNKFLSNYSKSFEDLLVRFSLGWLFIGFPRKVTESS